MTGDFAPAGQYKRGKIKFEWDNSFSKLTAKTVRETAGLLRPVLLWTTTTVASCARLQLQLLLLLLLLLLFRSLCRVAGC